MELNNPCFRCGKQRVVVSKTKERIGGSWVTTTNTSCPDPECQKILNKQIEKERITRENLVTLNKTQQNSFGRQKGKVVLDNKLKTH